MKHLLIAGWIFIVQVPTAILPAAHDRGTAQSDVPQMAITPVQVPSNGFFPTENACNTAQANWVSSTGEPAQGCLQVNQ